MVFRSHIPSTFFISEAFLESIPQTHLTIMVMVLNFEVVSEPGPYYKYNLALFLVGFISSVLSASLGMARMLMNGPCKLVKKQGHLGGYAQAGFAMVMLSIMCVLMAKAGWLAFSTLGSNNPLFALVWIGVSLAPQLILVSLQNQILHCTPILSSKLD